MSILGLFGYPKEIQQLKNQLPKSDRDAVISQYKKLSTQNKNSFKKALREADIQSASDLLGRDLSKYHLSLAKSAHSKTLQPKHLVTTSSVAMPKSTDLSLTEGTIVTRVNTLVSVPTSIDPTLVAAAAKRYEAAVPTLSASSDVLKDQQV